MQCKGWLLFVGMAALVAGCSGKAVDDRTRSAGVAGSGEDADSGGKAGGGILCTGTLAEVAAAWGFDCPHDYCDATSFASACGSLPNDVTVTSSTTCWDQWEGRASHMLQFELSSGRRKVCFYRPAEGRGGGGGAVPATLVGAAIRDDADNFCSGSSTKLAEIQLDCEGATKTMPETQTLCDLAHPEQNQANDDAPRACYTGSGCAVCCPATPPDCSDKPEAYGSCLPFSGSICSCGCYQGGWTCPC